MLRSCTSFRSNAASAVSRIRPRQVAWFASTPAPAEEGPPPIIWTTHRLSSQQIAKVDAIFHKILWLDMFETQMLTDLVNARLGLHLTDRQRSQLSKQMDARAAQRHGISSKKTEAAAEEDEAPKTVELKLTGFDAKSKIKVIKEVRAIAGLGLKEAKELVESAPKVVQKDISPEVAEEIKAKLEAVGGTVEIA